MFGPWLPWLFGVGTILLVGGLVARKFAPGSVVAGLGRGAANVGWRMMLLAVVAHLAIWALKATFSSFLSNLRGRRDGTFMASYSPDSSPIEEALRKLKALPRRAQARTKEALVKALGRALDAITPGSTRAAGSATAVTLSLGSTRETP